MAKQQINPTQTIRPMFSGYMGSQYDNLTSGTYYKMTVDTENFDIGNNFNPTTNTYTISVTGYYQINFGVEYTSSSTVAAKRYVARMVKNGNVYILYAVGHSGVAGSLRISGNGLVYLAAGDTLTLECKTDAGVNTVDVAAGITTGFDIFQVG